MATGQHTDVQFIPTAPAFAICGVCDSQYPVDASECGKCKSPLSVVRKCPQCERIVSAKHERCLYCSLSFVQEGEQPAFSAPRPISATDTQQDSLKRRRALVVSVAVFLSVMFLGLMVTLRKMGSIKSEVAASSYLLRAAPLRLQPNSSAGISTTLGSGAVVSLTGMAVDPEGHRWYILRDGGRDSFLKVTDVAPPKVILPDMGTRMLRAWLLAFRDPDLVPEADSAVDYFCTQFPTSSHCSELRMLAGAQFRSIAQSANSSDTLNRARRMYQHVVDAKDDNAAEAAKDLRELDTHENREGAARPSSRPKSYSSTGRNGLQSEREYALVDRAEVRVRVPDLRTVAKSEQIRVPIAHEIRINGKVAVPSTATCTLKISGSTLTYGLEVQLTAIAFGNKIYPVITRPQPIPTSGALVVFPLESSLLVGK